MVARIEPVGSDAAAVSSAGCFSACVYALIGASKRVIPVQSRVGIHRMFACEDELDASGTTTIRHRRYDDGALRAYLKSCSADMGASPA